MREIVKKCLACKSTNHSAYITTSTMMAPQDETWSFSQCHECGLVFLNSRVPAPSLGQYYQEYYLPYRGGSAWGRYNRLVEKDQLKIDRQRANLVKSYITDGVVLDIGCGKPTFLSEICDDTDFEGIGVDFSDHGWSTDTDNYAAIELHVSEPHDTKISKKADAITMWHYLEHDYDPDRTLTSMLDHAHDETKLIIEVPNFDSSTRRSFGEHWSGFHTPRHTGLFTPSNIKLLLESSGWEVIQQYTYGTLDPYTLDWMSRMERKKIDWSFSMEPYFWSYVIGKMLRPWYYFHKYRSDGFMTVIAQPINL